MEDWTTDVVARIHRLKITKKSLAASSGYTPQYISMVLNGHKDTQQARKAILSALEDLERKNRNIS